MAVVGVAKPIAPGRECDDVEDGLKVFRRTYFVETDDPYDGQEVVLSATGLPLKGDPYPSHATAIVVRRTPRQLPETRLHWHVEVEYSTHSVDRDENPLNTKPEIEWDYEPFDEPVAGTARVGVDVTQSQVSSTPDGGPATTTDTTGYYGFALVNKAGDPLEGFISRPNYLPVVRYTRNENESTFTSLRALVYGNTVNSDSWNGFLPRQVWLKPLQATHEVQYAAGIDQPDIRYWRVRYTFVLKAETWDTKLLNYGPRYLKTAGQTTKEEFGANGIPKLDLLKEDGTRYAANTPLAQKKPTWLHFRLLREVPFLGLAINLNPGLTNLRRRR